MTVAGPRFIKVSQGIDPGFRPSPLGFVQSISLRSFPV